MKQFIKDHRYLLVIILLALITRLFFLGNSLWHNDAVDFLNSAIHLAAKGEYLPAHAPDYPAWVVILAVVQKITHWLSGDYSPIFPSNLITALLGILTIILLYYLVLNLTVQNKKIAFFSCLILIFHPSFWFYNELALSDTAAVFFVVLTLIVFDHYLRKGEKLIHLIFAALCFTLAGFTRIPNFFFIAVIALLFFIYHWRRKRKITYQKILLFIFIIVIFPLFVNLIIYGLIHHWDFFGLMSISRRVNPSLLDLWQTAVKLWIFSMPLFFLSYLGGLITTYTKKQWYLFTYLFLPLIIYFYYYAGWWQHGSFDIDRYLLILSPFISLGAALGFYQLSNYLKSKSSPFYLITFGLLIMILVSHLFLITLNLFDLNGCTKIKQAKLFNSLFPGSYCQINNYHNSLDDKLALYQTINRILPDDAVVIVGVNDWSYPYFFANDYGLGQRIFYKLKKSETESLDYLKTILANHSPLYLPHQAISLKLLEQIEQQDWQLNVLQPSEKIMILKIAR